jgi:rhodanese-related sulfurtransferase
MRLKDLFSSVKKFSPIQHMDTKEARAFIDSHAEGTYTLLDVRQPAEYEKTRIPGSKLIPLAQLFDRAAELDSTKPVIVY